MSNKIQLHATGPSDELAWPEEMKQLTAKTNALEFFNDFSVAKPLIVSPSTLATEAVKQMDKSHESFAIILDDDDHFLGIIDHATIDGPQLIKKLSLGYKRNELTVGDIMLERKHLKAIDYSKIENSSITDVLTTLRENGEHHCIVLDECQHKIRGVLLGDNIASKLQLSINNNRSNFLSIFEAIN